MELLPQAVECKCKTFIIIMIRYDSDTSITLLGCLPNCTSTSPQCCWVVRIWKLMGKTTNVSPTSSTACCSMTGVTCSGSSIIGINWESNSIINSIPPSIGNLTSLQTV